jgi:hypothetical protein
MSTDVKPTQGRHRAPVEPRALRPSTLPVVVGALVVAVLAGTLLGWQVL